MTERPILFSGEMVRAILDGRKTQTRRVIKPQPECDCAPLEFLDGLNDRRTWSGCDRQWKCPYGAVGDLLWVREIWGVFDRSNDWVEDGQPSPLEIDYAIGYRADGDDFKDVEWKEAPAEHRQLLADDRWRPSIHMPRWASRITLEVTDVRAQRVQDIDERDARAEGVTPFGGMCPSGSKCGTAFAILWDSINAKRGFPWESNPWVWAVTFRMVN